MKEIKDCHLHVRVTTKQYAALTKAAKDQDLTITELTIGELSHILKPQKNIWHCGCGQKGMHKTETSCRKCKMRVK